MSEEKKPWEMKLDEFIRFAQKGKLHENTGEPAPFRIGSQKTALSLGESEGYSYEDIAYFYVSKRMPMRHKNTWQNEIKKQGWYKDNLEMIEFAYQEFISDAVFEGKDVPKKIMKKYL